MKILKRPDTNWSHKHTCSNCTAELEVEKGDVKYYHYSGDQREPESYETWSATCPVCKTVFTIPLSEITKVVQAEIRSGRLASPGIIYGVPFDK